MKPLEALDILIDKVLAYHPKKAKKKKKHPSKRKSNMRKHVAALLIISSLWQVPSCRAKTCTPSDKEQNGIHYIFVWPGVPILPSRYQAQESKRQSFQWPKVSDPFYPSWALVIITFFAVLYAKKTLKDVIEQTQNTKIAADAAKGSADAAKRSADSLIQIERAWILNESLDAPTELVNDNPILPTTLFVVLHFRLFGSTPAKMVEEQVRFHFVDGKETDGRKIPDLPEKPQYGPALNAEHVPELNHVLPPRKRFIIAKGLECSEVTKEDYREMINCRKFLCLYGYIKYRDSFEFTPVRETRFCYIYRTPVGGRFVDAEIGTPLDPKGFRIGGPLEYNEAT